MKYLKAFESSDISRIPKIDLTSNDIEIITDVFDMYMLDKYKAKFTEVDSTTKLVSIPDDPNFEMNYGYLYNSHQKIFDFVINYKMKDKQSFISDITKIKHRLSKFGYVSFGHAEHIKRLMVIGNIKSSRIYYLSVFKPTFPNKSMFPKPKKSYK